jgi:putative transposase
LRDFLRRKTPDQGFPRFKRKRWGDGSIYLTGQGLHIAATCAVPSKARGRIKLPKLGWCRIPGGRWPNGRVISGTIRRDGDRWHVSLRWEGETPALLPAPIVASIGVDMGLKDLAATSDGMKEQAPKHLRRMQRQLKRAQRRLSRREKEKQNRRRQAAKVRRLHRIVRNRRRDHVHKISRALIAKAALICVEGLSVKAMARTKLAKSVADTGMGELRRQLEYKAAWHDRKVVRIGRFDRSTGVCPDCLVVGPRLPLRVRTWTCSECGTVHDRDIAAARVVELRGLELVGRGTPEPAEKRTRGETGGQRRGRGLRRGASQRSEC